MYSFLRQIQKESAHHLSLHPRYYRVMPLSCIKDVLAQRGNHFIRERGSFTNKVVSTTCLHTRVKTLVSRAANIGKKNQYIAYCALEHHRKSHISQCCGQGKSAYRLEAHSDKGLRFTSKRLCTMTPSGGPPVHRHYHNRRDALQTGKVYSSKSQELTLPPVRA